VMQPRLLDLYCCEGGASTGYARAGYRVYGVDIDERDAYSFPFHHGSALDVLAELVAGRAVEFTLPDGTTEQLVLADFAVIHASPPCQAFSTITPTEARSNWPDLIRPTRELLVATGLPYVIENVEGARAELIDPMRLCGSSFGLRVRRHRWFESNVWLTSVPCDHAAQGEAVGVYGSHGDNSYTYIRPDGTKRGRRAANEADARDAMGMPWATWRGCVEAIPPAYAEFIGEQLIATLVPA
jgi:DNA (cytosine-5)-methyltransferase 1